MFRRTALLTICVGFVAAVAAGGVSAKDGFKMTVTLDPIPPLTQTALLLNCEFTLDEGGTNVFIDCHNAEPNPNPPKDTKYRKSRTPRFNPFPTLVRDLREQGLQAVSSVTLDGPAEPPKFSA